MELISIIVLLAALVAVYVFIVRPILHNRPELQNYYAQADGFWSTVWLKIKGWRTRIFARLLVIVGVVLPVLQSLQQIDMTPYLGKFAWAQPLVVAVIGVIVDILRSFTTGPVGEKV